MAGRIKSVAQRAKEIFSNSVLMQGRNRVKVEDLIKAYPDGITPVAMELMNGDKGEYTVVLFKEEPDKYFIGATAFTDLYHGLLEDCEGCIDTLNEELSPGIFKAKLSIVKTRAGNNFTKVEIEDL